MFKSNFILLLAAFFCAAITPAISQNYNLQLRSHVAFPGQTLANVCGYAQDGREYALLGGSKGLIIMDVTNPDAPVNITQIPGPDNLWKEIKVYEHYAYVTSEGGGGVQIVDMQNLPSANLQVKNYTGDGEILGQLGSIHALHIDEAKGFLYAYGSSLFAGGAVVLSLADPYNPTYVGKFNQLNYIHDGFALNDTLYACHIYTGLLSVVDMTDKTNPVLLGTVETPGKFTHNAWLLDDHRYILTTDEDTPSFVTSFDISDPTDIKELDRVSPNDGNGSIGHNTHVLNNYAVTSWYTDGVTIVDASDPENLVITGQFDTWPNGSGSGFDGCWGVYPFLPSGTVICTNIDNDSNGFGQFVVLTPTYQRAAYLQGSVKNASTGLALAGVRVDVSGANPSIDTDTDNFGIFKTGQPETGTFQVTFSKTGFTPLTIDATLATGETTVLDVQLEPLPTYNVVITVKDEATQAPITGATIFVGNADQQFQAISNGSGQFFITGLYGGNFTVTAGQWGYLNGTINISSHGGYTVLLKKGYYDSFGLDLGWTNESTASSGFWVRTEPVGTSFSGGFSNPEFDYISDADDQCYVTGNETGQGGAGFDDVDNGDVTLFSPAMALSTFSDAKLTFQYWFYNDGGNSTPNDVFSVSVTNGTQTVEIFNQNVSANQWRPSLEYKLKNYITLTDNVKVIFKTGDQQPGHLVEAGVDEFKVVPVETVGTDFISLANDVLISPNPTAAEFTLRHYWTDQTDITLEVRNSLGQVVAQQVFNTAQNNIQFGQHLPTGVYSVTMINGNNISAPIKVVKQ